MVNIVIPLGIGGRNRPYRVAFGEINAIFLDKVGSYKEC